MSRSLISRHGISRQNIVLCHLCWLKNWVVYGENGKRGLGPLYCMLLRSAVLFYRLLVKGAQYPSGDQCTSNKVMPHETTQATAGVLCKAKWQFRRGKMMISGLLVIVLGDIIAQSFRVLLSCLLSLLN